MLIDKSLKTNPTDIAEGFNAYFSSIAEKLLPKHTPGTKHFSEYLSERVDRTLFLNQLTQSRLYASLTPLTQVKARVPIVSLVIC